nr:unnamed protein product [Callosobruchus analis]
MESHYCRRNTAKHYLEHDFKSKAEVYKVYKEMGLEDSVTPLSIFSFSRTMDDMNIGLFKPRKDQCDSCIAYKAKAKDDARNEKSADKKKAEENLIYCFTMDVQAVMLCPKFEVSIGYYKTKLQEHNFTIYNLKTHQSKNFISRSHPNYVTITNNVEARVRVEEAKKDQPRLKNRGSQKSAECSKGLTGKGKGAMNDKQNLKKSVSQQSSKCSKG